MTALFPLLTRSELDHVVDLLDKVGDEAEMAGRNGRLYHVAAEFLRLLEERLRVHHGRRAVDPHDEPSCCVCSGGLDPVRPAARSRSAAWRIR